MDRELEDIKQNSNALAARIVAEVDASISRLEAKIDKLGDKIDGHSHRITKNETRIEHLQGFAKVIVAVLIAGAGFFASAYISLVGGGKP